MNMRAAITLLFLVGGSLAMHHGNMHGKDNKDYKNVVRCVKRYKTCMEDEDDYALSELQCHQGHLDCMDGIDETKFFEVPEVAIKNFRHCVNQLFSCHTKGLPKISCGNEFKVCAKKFTDKVDRLTTANQPVEEKPKAMYTCVKTFQSAEKDVTDYEKWVGDVCDCITKVDMHLYPSAMLKYGYCFRKLAGCSPATDDAAAECMKGYGDCLKSDFDISKIHHHHHKHGHHGHHHKHDDDDDEDDDYED